jgi:hypothetical protein
MTIEQVWLQPHELDQNSHPDLSVNGYRHDQTSRRGQSTVRVQFQIPLGVEWPEDVHTIRLVQELPGFPAAAEGRSTRGGDMLDMVLGQPIEITDQIRQEGAIYDNVLILENCAATNSYLRIVADHGWGDWRALSSSFQVPPLICPPNAPTLHTLGASTHCLDPSAEQCVNLFWDLPWSAGSETTLPSNEIMIIRSEYNGRSWHSQVWDLAPDATSYEDNTADCDQTYLYFVGSIGEGNIRSVNWDRISLPPCVDRGPGVWIVRR